MSNRAQASGIGRFKLLLGAGIALLATLALGVSLAAAVAPTVTIEPPTEARYTTVKVKGEVDPGDEFTWYSFETSTDGGASWSGFAFQGLLEPGGAQTVEQELTGLQPGTPYKVRLVANDFVEPEAISSEEEFETEAVEKPTVSSVTVSEVDGDSAHFEATVAPNAPESAPVSDPKVEDAFKSSWHFECEPSCGTPSGEAVAADDGPNTVEADATGLQPNLDYKVKLVASNAGGSEESLQEDFKTATVPPIVSKPSHHHLGGGKVALAGFVNPRNGEITTCQFEYGPSASYGQSAPCEALPPTTNEPERVRVELTGVTPGATYHFRFSVSGEGGSAQSADANFTARNASQQSSCPNAGAIGVGFLPGCRAWEMVSPPDKNGGGVIPYSLRTRAAADGNAATFSSLQAFGDARGTGVATEYISERTGGGDTGWSTHAISPRIESMSLGANLVGESMYVGEFSDDLDTGMFQAIQPLTGDPNVAKVFNLYRRTDLRTPGAGTYDLVTTCPVCESTEAPLPPIKLFKPGFSGASAGWSHLAFDSQFALTAEVPFFGSRRAYEWVDGAVRLAGVLPDGSPALSSVAGRSAAFSGAIQRTTNPISADGSRYLFTAPVFPPDPKGEPKGELYLRIEGRSTVQLNASERSVPDPGGPRPAEFWDMSSDAGRVFFTTAEALTDDAKADGQGKLYMWERQEGDETQQVTIDATGGAFILGFHGANTDALAFDATPTTVEDALESLVTVKGGNVSVSGAPGSYAVTFSGDFAGANVGQLQADGSSLTGGGANATVATTAPVENLILLNVDEEDTDGGGVPAAIGASDDGRYVYFVSGGQLVAGAPVLGGSSGIYLWHDGEVSFVGESNEYSAVAEEMIDGPLVIRVKQSYVTPDGRHLLLNARTGVGLLSTHGGTDYDHGQCPAGNEFHPCRHLYLYSADEGELDCVSCNPSGAATISSHSSARVQELKGGAFPTNHMSRVVSDDGRYTFFSTADRLVAADINGKSDAYVFDSVTGSHHLLSSGKDPFDSYFLEASADGADAFFVTAESLSGWDVDKSYDLYDARIGGGSPEPPVPPPACVGDACQPIPPNLDDPTPSSASFQGSGNRGEGGRKPRCPKGKRRIRTRNSKSRCVKRGGKQRGANRNRRAGK